MKPINACATSFSIPVATLGVLLLGIPVAMWGKTDYEFLLFFFIVYLFIQTVLSVINVIQIDEHNKTDITSRTKSLLKRFYTAELSLYTSVFTILFIAGCVFTFTLSENDDLLHLAEACGGIILTIFIFSIPYILFCSASVYLFHYLMDKEYRRKWPEATETVENQFGKLPADGCHTKST